MEKTEALIRAQRTADVEKRRVFIVEHRMGSWVPVSSLHGWLRVPFVAVEPQAQPAQALQTNVLKFGRG